MSVINTSNNPYADLGLVQAPAPAQSMNQLTQQDFMDLMITELQYQDPFKPMDNAAMASQFAEFSTVSGIEALNQSFSVLEDSLLSNRALQAAGLVGRSVVVPGNVGQLPAGGTLQGVAELNGSATGVTARIYSANGELVRQVTLGNSASGDLAFRWDGLQDDGEYAPPGDYRVEVQAIMDGQVVTPRLRMAAAVESVELNGPGQAIVLNVHGVGAVPFENVTEII
jgi:flagellar basal-body rod modification protein FlgD